MIIRKSPAEIEKMARAGAVVRGCLELMAQEVRPGVTTKELDKLASAGNAEMRVRSSGVVVYFFGEFAREGKDDFAV